MPFKFEHEIQVFYGPNKHVSYPAAVATIGCNESIDDISAALEIINFSENSNFIIDKNGYDLNSDKFELLLTIIGAFLDCTPENLLKPDILLINENEVRLAIPYLDPNAAIICLKASVGVCNDILQALSLRSGSPRDFERHRNQLRNSLEYAIGELRFINPEFDTAVLINAAREQNIPVKLVDMRKGAWLFGNGCHSRVFYRGASTDLDSIGGAFISNDKFSTSILIAALGFPAPKSALVDNLNNAMIAARSIGFPIIIKPNDLAQGGGVTANINSVSEIEPAFFRAIKASSSVRENTMNMENILLVEEHVRGDDFRIVVSGGRFMWALRRIPAQLLGDGKLTIKQLIAQENKRRNTDKALKQTLKEISIDDDLIFNLSRNRLSLETILPKGSPLKLRSAANISLGGTMEDVTSKIHADNIAMAESISRSFRLDSVGIDFIAKDISVSWSSQKCAVIEINASPGMAGGDYARKIIKSKFEHRNEGRIPVVVAIDLPDEVLAAIDKLLQNKYKETGFVSSTAFRLGPFKRSKHLESIASRVPALLADPSCKSLFISINDKYIEDFGFPIDFCSLVFLRRGKTFSATCSVIVKSACVDTVEVDLENVELIIKQFL